MANTFQITISAVDKATAVVRKVNNSVSQLARPFQEVGKSFKSLGRELGFQRLGKNLGDIGRQSWSAAQSVGSIVAPMAALTGAGTVAGVAALADSWARLGRSTVNTAANIGLSTQQLQRFQGMAHLTGVSSEAATSSLEGLGNTLQSAQWGRDNQALAMMNSWGVAIRHTRKGAVDTEATFMDLAKAIGRIKNPQAQAAAAAKFNMTPFLPLIRQGLPAMAALQKRAESMGLVMSGPAMQAATDFANSLDNLTGAGLGLKNSVMEQLTPALKPLVDQLANWITQNRTLISQDVGKWAKDFATWVNGVDWKQVGSDIHGFISGIGKVVDALGGWKGTAIAVGVAMNAGLIASVLTLGATLTRGGLGVLAFTAQLLGWKKAASEAGAATRMAATAADLGLGSAALAGGVVGASLALKGDTSQSSVDANLLQMAAMRGDRGAAEKLARIQLTHWYHPAPTDQDVSKRATEIASGAQAGLTPEQVAKLRPDMAGAEQRLAGLEKQYGLPHGLLDAVWNKESGRGKSLVSNAGAQGDFQFMPKTSAAYGVNPWDFNQSSDGAARMYRDLLKSNNGDLGKALAAYNWGQGNLNDKGVEAEPAETRNYVRDISAAVERANQPGAQDAAAPAAPAGPYSGGPAPQVQKHSFDVTFNGLPAGATAQVKSTSGAEINSRIGYSSMAGIA